ncbi:DivIVA domain-containing protein [Streptomyces sp. NPDC093970]|uniref:DivIVA domain-containing protein n=1 Tax=Streptomyces sp. NPDC093970 TaxID=3155076 RepID=UPI003438A432
MNATPRPYGGAGGASDRPVTPDELRSATFSRASLARRGFAEEEVRAVMRRAAETLGVQMAENSRLRAEVQRQRDWIRAHNVTAGPTPTGLPGVDAVLQHAQDQQAAERMIAHTREQAKAMLRAARLQAEAVLRQSREQAAQIAAEAAAHHAAQAGHAHVERLVASVREAARVLVAETDAFTAQQAQPALPPPPSAAAPQQV